jgi:hypothetical protein
MTFKTRFTAAVAAAALTLAGMTVAATPARAGNDELAKILLGATAIYIIGSAIENSNENGRSRASRGSGSYYGGYDYDRDYGHRGRRHARAPEVPAACAIDVRGRHSDTVYGARCLRRSGFNYHIPARCEVQVRGDHGRRTAYSGECLVRAGFELEHTRRRHN